MAKSWRARKEESKQQEEALKAQEAYWKRIFAQTSEPQQTKEYKLSEGS